MKSKIRLLIACTVFVCSWQGTAIAGPPGSCAGKFVGTWAYSGGTTTVSANGMAYPHCAMCVASQTWTCQGNTFLFSNSGPPGQFTATLVDSNHMNYGTGISTRVGGRAVAAKPSESDQLVAPAAKPTKQAALPVKPAAIKQAAAAPSAPTVRSQRQSCSDITGTGGDTGSSNCAPGNSVSPEITKYMSQGKSYVQAAQTVRQSDPTYNGWSAAAQQYRNAAAAFKLAGDLAQANAASDQAQTLEQALKIADQRAGQVTDPPPSYDPTVAQQDSGNDKIMPTPCQDLTGKYGCQNGRSGPMQRDARLQQGETQRLGKLRQGMPGGVTPDYQAEILALADALLAAGDASPSREKFRHMLERRLADKDVPVKPEELACLQPTHGTSPALADVVLRWRPQDIKKEAIDQSHLCDGVAEGDARDTCREAKYGEAVMWAEPELAGQCRSEGGPDHDTDKVAECARRKFLNAWAKNGHEHGIVSAPTPDNWILPASCNASAPDADRRESLREILRRRLMEGAARQAGANDNTSTPSPTTAGTPAADTSAAPPKPPATDYNEAYCNFMAQEVVRGELTTGGGALIPPGCKATIEAALAQQAQSKDSSTHPFSMSGSDTDKEIKRITQPEPAAPLQLPK